MTPKDYASVLVLRVAKYLMQLDGESVQMSNMQRAKVGVESIV